MKFVYFALSGEAEGEELDVEGTELYKDARGDDGRVLPILEQMKRTWQ